MDVRKRNKIWRVTLRKAYNIIVDYVEGAIPISVFQEKFMSDIDLQRTLRKKLDKKYMFLSSYNYSLYEYLLQDFQFAKQDWDNIKRRCILQEVLQAFLDNFGISYTPYAKYSEEYIFLLNIQPSWVDIDDDSLVSSIVDSIPNDLSRNQRVLIGKKKIKELFKYTKTYPRWLQNPEWPIINGKPLVFSHQERLRSDDLRTRYYFFDPDTKEEKVIEQFT